MRDRWMITVSSSMLNVLDSSAKQHFRAIADALTEDDVTRRTEAMRLTAGERMRIGLRLAEPISTDPAIDAELDRRALWQAELHARWLRLKRQ